MGGWMNKAGLLICQKPPTCKGEEMTLCTKMGLFAGATAAAFAGMAFGGSAPGDVDARIASLEQQITELKSESASNWLTDSRAEEIRAITQDVLADSDSRSSLLAGAGAGYMDGKGFYLDNGDGSFSMFVNFTQQFMAVYNNKDSVDESEFGFQSHRTLVTLKGNLWSPDLSYFIQGNFSASGGAFGLLDAFATWSLGNGWALRWGQMKAPFLHETLMANETLLFAERSYVEAMMGAGRTQAVVLAYMDDTFNFFAAYGEGAGNNNTTWNGAATEYSVTVRAEAVLAGNKKQFGDYTSWSTDEEFGFLLGGALHYQDSEYGTGAEETAIFGWTIDASLEFAGANLAAYMVGMHTDPNSDAIAESDTYGIVLQGGVFLVPDKFELAARYEWYDFEIDEVSFVTVGTNYYINGGRHGWKWQNDLVYGLDTVPAASSFRGILADAGTDDGQIVFRSMMQVATK